jgi:ketosteroid isomerase-like protein
MRALVCFALLGAFACSATPPRPDPAAAIRAQYDVLEKAFAARDVAAVLATRSPQMEVFGPQGQHDDAKTMEQYTRRWFEMNKPPIEVKFTILSTRVRGDDEATVTVLQQATRYQELAGKRRQNQHRVTQDETWIRTAEGWRIRKVENIRDVKRWIDGKRIDPSKPYDPDAPPFEPAQQP